MVAISVKKIIAHKDHPFFLGKKGIHIFHKYTFNFC